MTSEDVQDDTLRAALALFLISLCSVALGVGAIYLTLIKRPHLFKKGNTRKLVSLGLSFFTFSSLYLYFFAPYPHTKLEFLELILVVNLLFLGAFLLISPFVAKRKRRGTIRTSHLKNRRFLKPKETQKYRRLSFIGESLKTFSQSFLSENERVMHTLISGSTGSGKTTTLKALYIDAIRKNQPILIIDPKGNRETIEEFRQIALKGGKSEDQFKVFSIISPEMSAQYNPLKRGSAVQIKDRLMSSLEWSEQFYKNQAGSFLGSVIEVLYEINEPITIKLLSNLLTDLKEAERIDDLIKERVGDREKAISLKDKWRRAIKRSGQNLDNLSSQLRDLDNLEFGYLLDPKEESQEINLEGVIKNREVAYFQLNTMAYDLMAKAIGKLILSDLKGLASEIHGGKLNLNPTFFPIFIDEFGSFCSSSFIELLKMCRDVKFAMHLLFQSLADLDVVSPEFKSQVQQNCLTKIIMRIDDPDEVDFWAGVAGTLDTVETSYKTVQYGKMNLKTGQGNTKYTKSFKVEHDVFKSLEIGEAVILQKSPSREDLVKLWMPN